VFVATATGSMLHRPDCPVVANRPGVRKVKAGTPGFEPCKICEPELANLPG
jgi:methylphosphotriester-DNA--protein-cysteine methyltransferase